jgi:hypothetical protein
MTADLSAAPLPRGVLPVALSKLRVLLRYGEFRHQVAAGSSVKGYPWVGVLQLTPSFMRL